MNKKLLLIAAIGLFGSANAQELRTMTEEATSVVKLRDAVNYTERADLLVEPFNNASFVPATNTLGIFTRSFGPLSNVENHWTIASNRATVTGNETTDVFEEYLTLTNPYTIPVGSTARISVDFMLNKYWLVPSGVATAGGGDMKVQITNDNGVTWETIWWEGDQELLESSFSEDLLTSSGFYSFTPRINVPAEYVGLPIKVRFSLTGTNTASVYLDNFKIYTTPTEVVSILNVLNGDVVADYEYKRIPSNQTTDLQVWAVVRNLGFNNVNRNVSVNVEGPSGNFFSRSFANKQYELGVFDTLKIDTGLVPTEIGLYTLTTILSNVNDATLNDTLVSYFEVTENIYSHWLDDELVWVTSEPENDVIRWGQAYEIQNETDISSFNVVLYDGTTIGGAFKSFVSVFRPGATAWSVEYEGDFTVSTDDINTYYNIPMDYTVNLQPGEMVRIEIGQIAGSKLRLLATDYDYDNASTKTGPFGEGGAVGTYIGWDMTWSLEAVFTNNLAVTKVQGMDNVTIYPNPTTGIVNIVNTANEVLTIAVKDITGKEVTTTSVFGNGSVDLSAFGTGVYVIEMTNGVTRSAQRVIVK